MSGARRVLDIGTFTGMSALAMSEGLPDDDPESCVVTLENIDACADVAEACFAKAGPAGARIKLIRGNALESIQKLKSGKLYFGFIFWFFCLGKPEVVFWFYMSFIVCWEARANRGVAESHNLVRWRLDFLLQGSSGEER